MAYRPPVLLSSFALTLTLAGCTGDDGSASDTQASGSSTSAGTTAATDATDATGTAGTESATGGTGGSSGSTSSTTTGDATSTGDATTGDATTGTTGDPTTGTTGVDTTTGDATGTTGAIDSCDDFYLAFNAEVAEIRGCTSAKECGVEIKGTSCGCTRNWVARLDADLSEFEALVELADELECELPFFSTCDCPEADGFTCTDGLCSWNYI